MYFYRLQQSNWFSLRLILCKCFHGTLFVGHPEYYIIHVYFMLNLMLPIIPQSKTSTSQVLHIRPFYPTFPLRYVIFHCCLFMFIYEKQSNHYIHNMIIVYPVMTHKKHFSVILLLVSVLSYHVHLHWHQYRSNLSLTLYMLHQITLQLGWP